MMGVETIKRINRERAEIAAAEGQTPYVYFDVREVDEAQGFPFPFIGDHRPEGWELVHEHFVDSSGFGADDEPALSVGQFKEVIKDAIEESPRTVGWAVIEAGQFQVYVGQFMREE